jgi:hypothetical protein
MQLSFITIRTFARAVAVALGTAALVASAAQARSVPTGKYGALDPWAYRVIHATASGAERISERSAGQNGWTAAARRPVALSPNAPLLTEHSAGQNGSGGPSMARANAQGPLVQVRPSSGFDWADAGLGAVGGTLGVILVAAAATLGLRRRHALTHTRA